ncbi:hypothetical protein [Vibrio cyclitrophicus]|uniref:hypothetical protein n=1 Tax=Vibrio cyclitrophicus TaxID=47951 RepID=UPI0032E3B045
MSNTLVNKILRGELVSTVTDYEAARTLYELVKSKVESLEDGKAINGTNWTELKLYIALHPFIGQWYSIFLKKEHKLEVNMSNTAELMNHIITVLRFAHSIGAKG